MAEFAANSETSQTYSVDISCFNEQRIRDFAEIFQAVGQY